MNEGHEMERERTRIEPRRASLSVTAILNPLWWGLVHQLPVICGHILGQLGKLGVGPDDLRVDTGDGSVGGHNLAFWALDYQVRSTLRLPRLEVNCRAMEQVDIEDVDAVIQSVLEATEKTNEDIAVERYEVVYQMHVRPVETNPYAFLLRFIKQQPKGLGDCIRNAVSFSFAGNEKRIACSILADMSRDFIDSIYIEGRVTFDGTKVDKKDLRAETTDFLTESLAALELTLPGAGEAQ